ncbi:MAG: M48 family metallopeptidase [bacterium]|nr:M48 family metallopeptidase [bacterium]
MATETSEVRFGTSRIVYGVRRSARRKKTVAVAVEPDGAVRVTAPVDTARGRLDEIVHKKARWILERRRRQDDLLPSPGRRELVSGESFLYLGRQYRLKVCPADAGAAVRLERGWLVASVPRGLAVGERAQEVRARLIAWYRGHAARRLPERVRALAPAVGVEPAGVLIREPRKRWGSCDARGNLRLNWRIVQAPRRLVDYVVVHELVHLLYPVHDRDFWALLGRTMPDYEQRREELRRLGKRLLW